MTHDSLDISSKDRFSELPNDVLFECLSSLEMKNAAQTSIVCTSWRYLWTHLTNLDFDPKVMYPEEFRSFWSMEGYETRKYFGWINQVVRAHRGPFIDKFRVHSRYVSRYDAQIDEWVKFALSKRVRELVLDFIGFNLICDDHSRRGYPFRFYILTHPPCYIGITALQSLHLHYVDVSDGFIEFLLSHCHHLERLFLDSTPVSNLKIKSSKLKYLTIIMRFWDLEELKIDTENLLYFGYDDAKHEGGPRIVFKNLPSLVETSFRSAFCRYPFPVFETLSLFSNQLCKLSLEIALDTMMPNALVLPDGPLPVFPNVKHFTCTIVCEPDSSILSMKRFIEACPLLEEFKLQVSYTSTGGSEEASELHDIELEDEKEKVETDIGLCNNHNLEIGEVENMNEKKQSHPNLRKMELIGFLGTCCDVELALAVVSYACSLQTIVCDPRGLRYTTISGCFYSDGHTEYNVVKARACKLEKIVAPKVKVVII